MVKINSAFNRCKSVSLKEHAKNSKNLEKKVIKLLEEAGEFAAGFLMSTGSKNTKKTKEQVEDNVLEEACDVTLVVMSILFRKGYTINQIADKLQLKMDKWEKQVDKLKEITDD